jgi:hypothetical protein
MVGVHIVMVVVVVMVMLVVLVGGVLQPLLQLQHL